MLKNLYLILAISWTITVTLLCLVSSSNLPKVGVQGADKYVHFGFHFVYVVLWFLYAYNADAKSSKKHLNTIFISSVFFGIIIEILQGTFSKTRNADLFDILVNVLGGLTALLISKYYLSKLSKHN